MPHLRRLLEQIETYTCATQAARKGEPLQQKLSLVCFLRFLFASRHGACENEVSSGNHSGPVAVLHSACRTTLCLQAVRACFATSVGDHDN